MNTTIEQKRHSGMFKSGVAGNTSIEGKEDMTVGGIVYTIPYKKYKDKTAADRIKQLLPEQELFKIYCVSEFIHWVESKLVELSNEAKNSEIFKKMVRQGSRRSYKFYNEAVPLKYFLEKQRIFTDSSKVLLSDKNTNYDVKIINDVNEEWFVEITTVSEDRQEHYRRVILNETGCVGAYTEITKSCGELSEGEQESISNEEKMSKLLKRVRGALEKKHKIKYPFGTLLVISAGYVHKIDDVAISKLLSEYKSKKFSNIFFVSSYGSFVS